MGRYYGAEGDIRHVCSEAYRTCNPYNPLDMVTCGICVPMNIISTNNPDPQLIFDKGMIHWKAANGDKIGCGALKVIPKPGHGNDEVLWQPVSGLSWDPTKLTCVPTGEVTVDAPHIVKHKEDKALADKGVQQPDPDTWHDPSSKPDTTGSSDDQPFNKKLVYGGLLLLLAGGITVWAISKGNQ